MKKTTLIPLVFFPCALFAQVESISNPSFFAFSREVCWMCTAESYAVSEDVSTVEAIFSYPFFESEAISVQCSGLIAGGFQQSFLSLAFAKYYAERISFALSTSYVSLSFSDAYYGKKHGLDFSFASCFRIQPSCYLSLQWKNPFGFFYFAEGGRGENIPSELSFTGLYCFSNQVITYAEYVQNFSSIFRLNVGVDVLLQKKLRLYVALRFPDVQMTFGVGCKSKLLQYVASCAYSRSIGMSIGLGIEKNGVFNFKSEY